MRLREFQAPSIKVRDLINALRTKFRLEQNGGSKRVYTVGKTGELGVVFGVNGTPRGIGVTWARGTKLVQTVYVWKVLDVDHAPDIAIDLPVDADLEQVVMQLSQFIKSPRLGVISEAVLEASQPEPANDTQAAATADAAQDAEKKELAGVQGLAKKGSVMLMARRANGTLFQIPGIDNILKRVERLIGDEYSASGEASMEDQYADMEAKVKMVANGETKNIRALLITGMPSAGKTHRVMAVLKALGLTSGRDFVKKTGKVTATALFRTFIEQIDGLSLFDDADDVWDDETGVNIMKGALDTGAVREITYDVQRSIPTASMEEDERNKLVNSMSRILRGRPQYGDLESMAKWLPKGVLKSATDDSDEAFEADLAAAQDMIMKRPPNMIPFRGRVIFISNRDIKQFDPAILTRTFHIHMDFKDGEMLDFIDKIAHAMESGGIDDGGQALSTEQIDEVLAFVRQRHETAGFKTRINFRFIQKCFDFRRGMTEWKRNIAAL